MPREGNEEIDEYSAEHTEAPASKRQKTLSKVCETCRLKKSRCDNARPQCSTCHRKNVECVYREKGQPGLRPGYGKAVEFRLETLESNMERIHESLQTVLQHVQHPRQQDLPHTNSIDDESVGVNQDHNEFNGSARDRIEDANDGTGLWQTPPPTVPDLFNGINNDSDSLQATINETPGQMLSNGIPSAEVVQELANIFFELVYPWCPLFHKESFMGRLSSTDYELLVHGIIVVAFRFWNKSEPSNLEREKCIEKSREHILLRSIDTCTLVSAQALVLLAVDSLSQGCGPRAWNTMSMLATAARHLGLATNPALSNAVTESNTPLVRNDDDDDNIFPSPIEIEERTRLFWVICSLDRFSSVAHGQPGGISTKTIKMPYPKAEDQWEDSTTVAPLFDGSIWVRDNKVSDSPNMWIQYIGLLGLSDRCNQLLIRPVNLFDQVACQRWQDSFRELDRKLSAWKESFLQASKAAPTGFDPMWYLLHANFYLIRIRMYTVAAYPSSTSPHVRPSTSAQARCRNAVKDVADLVRPLQVTEMDRLGPIFAFVLWVASRSLVILYTTGYETSHEKMNADIEPLLYGLKQLGMRWPCAARYSDLIQLVLDTKDSPGGPSYLHIFNDTKRTAYGLEKCLGAMAQRRNIDIQPNSFDFLDMPFLDAADGSNPWMSSFRLDEDSEIL